MCAVRFILKKCFDRQVIEIAKEYKPILQACTSACMGAKNITCAANLSPLYMFVPTPQYVCKYGIFHTCPDPSQPGRGVWEQK